MTEERADRGPTPERRPHWIDFIFRIRYRLLLINVLIVTVPLVGIGFARFYEREMLGALERDMIHQAQLLRQVLLADPAGVRLPERAPMLAAAAADTRTRIRLLDPQGAVVSDSHAGGPPEGRAEQPPKLLGRGQEPSGTARAPRHPPIPVDTAHRSEVKKALRGQYAAATRVWEKGDRVFLFAAVPVARDGRVEGAIYVTRSTNPVRTAMHRLRTTLLKVLLAALAATAVLSLFLAATISRPLTRLTRIAERIAGGDRRARLSLERRDEIGQLARAFDTMARKLDERARYVAELSANISHEFKSPLTGIRGATELLLEGAAEDPAARARFLENILQDAHRLDRLVTRLLELGRVESDAGPAEVFDYEALVREVAGQVQGPAEVVVEYVARTMHLFGRRAHVGSALANLVENAEGHARPDSPVTVRVVDLPGGRVRTTVHNHGPVISEANLGRIWDRFFTTRGAAGGTGLGLPIVKSVVQAHGGSVDVTSTEDAGTTFGFELPTGGGDGPPA